MTLSIPPLAKLNLPPVPSITQTIQSLLDEILGLTSNTAMAKVTSEKEKEMLNALIALIISHFKADSVPVDLQEILQKIAESFKDTLQFFHGARELAKYVQNHPELWDNNMANILSQIAEELKDNL
ncbi:MAG: hypothetical protein JSS32_02395 [Verrucomicrobia bacterium]|nr:hypothetical protein [Verrucomicrobiota bacterium]